MPITNPPKNQNGILHLGLIFVLLFAIAAGTILVQQRTNFNPRADEWWKEEEQEPAPEPEAEPEKTEEQQPESEQPPSEEAAPDQGQLPSPDEPAPANPDDIPAQPNPPDNAPTTADETVTPEQGGADDEESNPGLVGQFLKGTQEFLEDLGDSAGNLGEDLGILDSEKRMEGQVEEEADSRPIPNPIDIIKNKEIPEEDRQEAIRVFAESNGVDPNDSEAVNKLLADLQLLDRSTQEPISVEVQPISLPFATQEVGAPDSGLTPPSAEEFEFYTKESEEMAIRIFGNESIDLDYGKKLISFALQRGMTEQEITAKLNENQDYFFAIMKNYIQQDSEGTYYLNLSTQERPSQANILWSIVSNNNAGSANIYIGRSQEELLDQLRAPYNIAMIYQAITSKNMDPFTVTSRERLNRLVEYSIGNYSNPDNTRDKYDQVVGVVQEGRTIVLGDHSAIIAYYGAGNVPSNIKPEDFKVAGWAIPGDGTIIVKASWSGAQDVHDHEWIHQSAYASDPQYYNKLYQQFGGDAEGILLADMLIEGTTETAAVLASHLASNAKDGIAYTDTVSDIRGTIVAEIIQNGYSIDQAYAIITKAALTGDYYDLFKTISNKNLELDPILRGRPYRIPSPEEKSAIAAKGIKRVKDILRTEYLNNSSKTTNGKTESLLPNIFDFLPPLEVVHAQEGWSITENDNKLIPAVSDLDQGFALGQAISESEKPNISPLNTNFTNQVVIVNQVNKQKPVAVSNNLFELNSKANIASNMFTQYGELGQNYTKSILKASLLDPNIIKQDEGYRLQTGRAGAVKGNIKKSYYKVKLNPILGFNLSLPATINTGKNSVLAIGVTSGNGTIKQTPQKSSFSLNKMFTAFAAEGSLTTVFYSDNNKNSKWDRGEEVLPWAGATIELIDQNIKQKSQDKPVFSIEDIPFFKIQLGTEK